MTKRGKKPDPFQSPGYRQYARHFIKNVLPQVRSSSYFIAIAPVSGTEADVKMATEVGMCILLDKPLIVFAPEGRPVAERLLRIADHVIRGDMDSPLGMAEMQAKLQRILMQ